MSGPELLLSYDGEPTIDSTTCNECDELHETSVGFVLEADSALAVYWASWYPHAGEAWLDLAMGSWIEPEYSDHVTFGTRIGHIEGHTGPQCSLVNAAELRSDAAMFGQKLSRDDALSHVWLPTFWTVVDWLLLNDPVLQQKL